MKKWLALFAFLLSLSQVAYATAQIPETLILEGQGKALFTNPLDPWLRARGNANKLKPYISEQRCTASWRGYAGTWEIKGEWLVLIKIKANPCNQTSMDIPLSVLFPDQSGPIAATWFSGSLTVPDGKQIQYVHMGYMSKYERYIIFQIEQGKIVGKQVVNELSGQPPVSKPFPANDGPPPPRIVP